MIIEMKNGKGELLKNFKGGEKTMNCVSYADSANKIMYNILEPGGSIGYHKHEGNSEIVYVLSGKAKILMDDGVEYCEPGQCHYCPEGHSHSVQNPGTEDLVFFAVVPQRG